MTPESSTAPAPSVDPIGGGRGAIPRCNNMAPIAAPPEFYPADATIVATDDAPIMDWARARAGFEELWIDRDQHDGWLTFAFSSNVLPTRIELAGAFPGIAAIVVEVPWTMVQLRAVQQRVLAELRPGGSLVSTGIQPQHGVVTIGVAVLLPEVVAEVEAKFGGQPVCIEGGDPKDVPPEGPQAQAGDGWRLLADQDQTGGPYRTGIAADADGYAMLWAEVGLEGDPPHVDFQTEVVVWFGAVHGSSCPRLRLDDVAVDLDQAIVHSVITRWEFGACTADAIGHAYVVAVERAHLPTSGFTIQLQAADPPGGVIDQERTFVPGNLSVAGATIAPR
jgi:hypothetical protein